MKNYGFKLIFFFYSGMSFAQLQDNFSDGNFSDPAWSGLTNQFIINAARQLQLNNSVADLSFISTPFLVTSLDNFEWQIYVKQTFSSSVSNYGRVYLTSNESNLTKPLNGYYLQFGEAGSNDAVQLFKQTGLVSSSVCRARDGGIATAFALRIKVLRNEAGLWELWIDYAGGTSFELEATGTDQTYSNSSFFGLFCIYTASNASKFYFDDVYAGPHKTDTTLPVFDSIKVLSLNAVALSFSESLDQTSVESALHYSANNGLGNPQTATLQPDNHIVNLVFSGNFSNGIQNQLTVSDVKDLAGNMMITTQLPFLFFHSSPLQAKDVIITEFFPDPVPQIGLPNTEFIELYNRSANAIDVSGWKLSDGTSTVVFPPQVILPLQYWIVTAPSSAQQYASFGNIIHTSGFLTLNNESDTLTLKSMDGRTIDSLNYSLAWYGDTDKENGGWTLELIDPNNPCGEEENWTASEDPLGGTPGKQNSAYARKPDRTGPKLLSVVPIHQNALVLNFDEKLDSSLPDTNSFSLTPSMSISKSFFPSRSLRQIQLQLESFLPFSQLFTLKVHGVSDCNQNEIQAEHNQIQFALPEPADSLDILANEILFNPRPNGTDFVEIYNSSQKYINLKNWKLANIENQVLKNIQEITFDDFILSPQTYLVFTMDPILLKNNYPRGLDNHFFSTPLPSFPDDEGSFALVNDQGKVIDYLSYSKSFHSDLIKDDEGVSLERISFSDPTNDVQNWKSATSQSGFATPGYVNSNARPEDRVARGNINIEPEIFIPSSGVNDFAKIMYTFEQSGYIANIKILDQQGHLIKVISNNETLGYEGFFRWDGDRDDGSKARTGYYNVWVEVFTVSGMVDTFRKRVGVATK